MWGNKKPDGPQPGRRAKKFTNESAPKSASTTWEGTTAMSTDAMRPLGATADRSTARLGPACT